MMDFERKRGDVVSHACVIVCEQRERNACMALSGLT